jgi:hypothetical protein
MSHYQIVCGACGYRIHSDLLAKSLETNKMLADAIRHYAQEQPSLLLSEALEKIPTEIAREIYPALGEPL